MKLKHFQAVAVALACVGMVLPQAAYADPAVPQSNDVALRSGGLVVGQVVNHLGAAQANKIVSIQQGELEVVRTTTDQNGIFAAQGMRGGQYLIVTEQGQSLYRFWAPDTAPPSAQQAAVVVNSPDVVRGQMGMGYGYGWLDWMRSHPYLTAGIIATAIAVPVALAASNNDDDDPPGS